jgi:hypothetical protein
MSKEDEKIDISEQDKDFLKNKMLDLENQFKIMDKKMDKILEILEKDCKKMSDHIDFVENVYDNVKMPFYYVMDKVNYLVTNDNKKILDRDNNNISISQTT